MSTTTQNSGENELLEEGEIIVKIEIFCLFLLTFPLLFQLGFTFIHEVGHILVGIILGGEIMSTAFSAQISIVYISSPNEVTARFLMDLSNLMFIQ